MNPKPIFIDTMSFNIYLCAGGAHTFLIAHVLYPISKCNILFILVSGMSNLPGIFYQMAVYWVNTDYHRT